MARGRRSRGGNRSSDFAAPAPTAPPAAPAAQRSVVAVVDADEPMSEAAGRPVVVHSAWSAGDYDHDYEEDYDYEYDDDDPVHGGWSPAEEEHEYYDDLDDDPFGHSDWSPAEELEQAYFDEDEEMEFAYEDEEAPRAYSHHRPPSLIPAEPLAPPPLTLCRFFVLGKCRYGSRCTYSHTLPTQTSCGNNQEDEETVRAQVAATMVDCPFFQRGNCKYGDYCRLRHASQLAAGNNNQQQHAREHSGRQATGSATAARAHAAAATQGNGQTDEFTCGICFEDIVVQGKYFGLLSCDHCFCLECLRAWRQSKDMEVEVTRSCPACRLPSNYIVPSLKFCTGDEKKAVVDAYKRHLAIRECKYFNGSYGSCPFGPNCFYAHRNSSGDDVKHLDRARRPRRRQRSDSDDSFTSSFASESTRGSRRGGHRRALSALLDRYSEFLIYLESLGPEDGVGSGWD